MTKSPVRKPICFWLECFGYLFVELFGLCCGSLNWVCNCYISISKTRSDKVEKKEFNKGMKSIATILINYKHYICLYFHFYFYFHFSSPYLFFQHYYNGWSPKNQHKKYSRSNGIDLEKEEWKNDDKPFSFQSVDYSAFWIFLFIFFLFNAIYWCIYGS